MVVESKGQRIFVGEGGAIGLLFKFWAGNAGIFWRVDKAAPAAFDDGAVYDDFGIFTHYAPNTLFSYYNPPNWFNQKEIASGTLPASTATAMTGTHHRFNKETVSTTRRLEV